MKEKDQVMKAVDGTESAASLGLAVQVVEATKKVCEAMFPIELFRNLDFRELVIELKLTHAKF